MSDLDKRFVLCPLDGLHTSSKIPIRAKRRDEYLCFMNGNFGAIRLAKWSGMTLLAGVLATPAAAQQDSLKATETWWKGLFRPVEMPECVPSSEATVPTAQPDPAGPWGPAQDSSSKATAAWPDMAAATFQWTLPDGLASLDSLDKADPAPLQGYRIQIYFGDLQEARGVRAAFRRDHPDIECQLLPITPNYAVTVGNYRDMWSAQRALRDGDLGSWKNALVIPSPINLPPLR